MRGGVRASFGVVVMVAMNAIIFAQVSEDYALFGHVVWYTRVAAAAGHYLTEAAAILLVFAAYGIGRHAERNDW